VLEPPPGVVVVVVTEPSGFTVVVVVMPPGADELVLGGATSLFDTLHATHTETPLTVPGHVPGRHEFC
jgi:hypothetical protein